MQEAWVLRGRIALSHEGAHVALRAAEAKAGADALR